MVFVHATPSQKQEYFIKSHILAYEFYGGVLKVNVPDNLKSAVISNNKEELELCHCKEMDSCDEAMYFYKICNLSRLDGDKDGIPCEALCL